MPRSGENAVTLRVRGGAHRIAAARERRAANRAASRVGCREMRVTNNSAAEPFVKPDFRKGWTL